MTTLLVGGFALTMIWVVLWVCLTDADRRTNRASRLLWIVIIWFPVMSTLARGRPAYGQAGQVWATPLMLLVTPVQIAGASLALVLCLGGLSSLRKTCKPVLAALTFYCVAQVASDVYNGSLRAGLGSLISVLVLVALVLSRESLPTIKARVTVMLRVYIYGSILVHLIAPTWTIVPASHSGRNFFGLETRFMGLASGPNYMALIAALAFLLEVFPIYRQRGWLMSASFALAVCVWSQGRSAILVVAVTIIVIAARRRSRDGLVISVLAVLSVGCGLLLVPSVQAKMAQLFSQQGLSEVTSGRTNVWSLAWSEFRQSPFVGRGSSVFGAQYWNDGAVRGGSDFANAHNQFLQALAQGGVIGLVATVLLLAALIHLARLSSPQTKSLSAAVLGVILAQLIFGTPLRSSGFSVNLLALALCVGVLSSLTRTPPIDPPAGIGTDASGGSRHPPLLEKYHRTDRPGSRGVWGGNPATSRGPRPGAPEIVGE